jgi:hypothetical protein
MSAGPRSRLSDVILRHLRADLEFTNDQKARLHRAFCNNRTQNPRPKPQEESKTQPRKIRDLSPRLLRSVASTPPAQGPYF